MSHADELPQLNQLRCRRTDARKRREKRLAGPRNSNSKLFVCADPNQLQDHHTESAGKRTSDLVRIYAMMLGMEQSSDLTAGAGARIGVRTGGPARRDTPGCSG